MTQTARNVEMLPVGQLWPAKRNARTHPRKQIKQLGDSIDKFGFQIPVLIDESNVILAGHARIAAAKLLGMTSVPCLRAEGMSADEKRAFQLADNKLAQNATWDFEILAGELGALVDLGFDLSVIGFDTSEVDSLIGQAEEASPGLVAAEDATLEPEIGRAPIVRQGEVWLLGRHRLICGDAKDAAILADLMDGEEADMVFTDPPYNLKIRGHVSGLGRTKHREFAEASGEMSSVQYMDFLHTSLQQLSACCRNGAIVYTCIDWRHLAELEQAGRAVFGEQKNLCVWAKTNAGMGTFYRSQHELIPVWKVGDAPHVNNFGLGEGGRYRTNVWTYAGVNTFKAERSEELVSHPTVKPVALVADAIRDVSHRGDIVLDVFGGSGTTLIAAEKTGRRGRLVELDPLYCDVTIRRWQVLTGKQATRAKDAARFDDLGFEQGARAA